jgi:hypothetical protein
MSIFAGLLLVHVVLLALASTGFTVVTAVSDGHFQWEYFRYFSQTGWGAAYQSPYSLPVALTYLVAYTAGLAAYCVAYRRGSGIIGLAGMLLCVVGLASFGLELSHWLVDHQRSFIASAPIALVLLAPAAAIQQHWRQSDAGERKLLA